MPKTLSPTIQLSVPRPAASGVLDGGHMSREPQTAPASVDLDPGQSGGDTPPTTARVDLDGGHGSNDPQADDASVDLTPGHTILDTQTTDAGGTLDRGHSARDPHVSTAPVDPDDALLLVLADSLNDVEGLRKATANQLHSLTRESDGKGGKGLSPESRAAVMLADRLAVLEQFEHATVLELKRTLRKHPLGPWVKRTVGLGEKQAARLIAAVGDPAWNHAEGRPRRGPAELWAYCGYAPGQHRRKGVRSNWNAEAKMRAYLCAESCMKQRTSPYRKVYDDARANWADHDTTDGHKHNHALRLVAKAILKDLWREARTVAPAPSNSSASASPEEDQ